MNKGLTKGDKVALLSLNSIATVGVMFLGSCGPVGLWYRLSAPLTPQQLGSLIVDSGSEFVFCDAHLQALITPVLAQIRIRYFQAPSEDERFNVSRHERV
jgi:hypothetical protein